MFDSWNNEADPHAMVEETTEVETVLEETKEAVEPEVAASVVEEASALSVSPQKSALSFDDKVLQKIVALNLEKIEGVMVAEAKGLLGLAQKKPVRISVDPSQGVQIDLSVILEYGVSAPETFQKIRTEITNALQQYTGLAVSDVNVKVIDVLTPDEFTRQA